MRVIRTDQTVFHVTVLKGAAEELVLHRELRNKYHTNRSIKAWSCFFLLKSLTTSCKIQNWIYQKSFLLDYCKANENTFRSQLKELVRLELITIDVNYNLHLASYKKAAEILGIDYEGTYKIIYDTELPGKQIFQYILRAEEIRNNQDRQLNALCYYADKNPLLRQSLLHLLSREGHHEKHLLGNKKKFQEALLKLQEKAFRYGSEIPEDIFALRADINRGVNKIRDDHKYLSAQSVSYMKSVLVKLNLISVEKKFITSKERCRLYVPEGDGSRREGYKWLKRKKETALRLTDQVQVKTQIKTHHKNEAKSMAAA